MAHAGQNPTKAVSTSVAAVASASHVSNPIGTRPPNTAAKTNTPATTRALRSQLGRLRLRKNMVLAQYEVNDTYLEAASRPKDSGRNKKSKKSSFSKKIAFL
jgi:hypothetical protein